MPDVPFEIAMLAVGGFCTALGLLWKRLIHVQDQSAKDLRDLVNAYHVVMVSINKAIEIEGGDQTPVESPTMGSGNDS